MTKISRSTVPNILYHSMFNYLHLVNCFYFSFIGLNDHSYDVEKRPRRTAKPRRPAQDPPKERMSTYSVGVVLRDWSVQFLECCYNILMKVVRVTIMHHSDIYLYCESLSLFSLFSLSLSLPLSLSLSLSLSTHTCTPSRVRRTFFTSVLWTMMRHTTCGL